MTRKAKAFLEAYSQTFSVAEAARRSGMTRDAHYKRLERDPRYKDAFDKVEEEIADTIREEVRRRAFGIKAPVFYKGAVVAAVTKYSDRMLELLARAHCAEFREQLHMDIKDERPKPMPRIRVEYVESDGNGGMKVYDRPPEYEVTVQNGIEFWRPKEIEEDDAKKLN